ncbi:hypothetical protein AJ79_04139 [Helicocarpus griseus UAMH5409]|uniref:Uncharacterized protein n=1 Tax=Helicocarpus griseus UAMH5409 TaxID=1447875 RepID=A0A2B7XV38_9EURO|nr:hypothetical protein AJ79_04139 [Helicocarpus griseus UAMH5409]
MATSTAMAPDRPTRPHSKEAVYHPNFSPIDERQYHEAVLRIPFDQTEEEVEKGLIAVARELGLESFDAIHPQFTIARYTDSFPTPSSSRFDFDTLPTSSQGPHYPNPNNISSPPTVSSSNEIASSMHSAASLSTRPTSHGSSEGPYNASITSSQPRHSQYFYRPSLSSSRTWSGNRERRARFSHFKLSFGKFPNFRRRSGTAAQTPISPVCSESRSVTPGAENMRRQNSQSKSGNLTPLPDINQTTKDAGAIEQSLNCAELQELRIVQEDQRDRYLEFKAETLELLYIRYEEAKAQKRNQHQKIEQDLVDQHTQEANRLEEFQLNAELDLVEELKREKQTLEIRIHHMEGYLSISASSSRPQSLNDGVQDSPQIQHQRQVTQKDKDHLLQKYRERDRIDTLHMSKIKVLRDTQERKYLETMSKQERKVSQVAEEHKRAFQELVDRCEDETTVVNMWFLDREQHLRAKWLLEEAITRRRLEFSTGICYAPLPLISFLEEGWSGN